MFAICLFVSNSATELFVVSSLDLALETLEVQSQSEAIHESGEGQGKPRP